MTLETSQADETGVLEPVREARAKAAFVLFTIHAHRTAADEDDGPTPYQPEVLHFANEAAMRAPTPWFAPALMF